MMSIWAALMSHRRHNFGIELGTGQSVREIKPRAHASSRLVFWYALVLQQQDD